MLNLAALRLPPTPIRLLFVALLIPLPAAADGLEDPFAVANRNPLVEVFGLPPARSAWPLQHGAIELSLQAEIANSFSVTESGPEAILIDSESYRGEAGLRLGIGPRTELGLRLPYLRHQGGFLDGFIEDWHGFWNLPNGDRDRFPRDRLELRYLRDRQPLLVRLDPGRSIGDLSFDFAHSLKAEQHSAWSLRGGFKVPTGASEHLSGSDAADIYAGIYHSRRGSLAGRPLEVHASAGLLRLGNGRVISPRQRDYAVFASSALAWRWREQLALKLQLDGHSPMYRSRLSEIGEPSLQLVFGGALRLRKGLVLNLSLAEDLWVDSAPDIVFQAGLSYRLD